VCRAVIEPPAQIAEENSGLCVRLTEVNHGLTATLGRANSRRDAITKTDVEVVRSLVFGAGLGGLQDRAGWPS
jgi:hypothetical protein